MKVLVLMSTYNGEKYVHHQIESVLKQKKVELEILVRDDGSHDETIDQIREFDDPRIRIIVGSNIGATNSFIELLKIASERYDYYAFCDQDDEWLDDKLFTAIHSIEHQNDVPALYYSGQILTDEDLNTIDNHVIDKKRTSYANCIFNQMAGCTAVFNRKLLQKFKQYIPKNILGHDVWIYRLCASLDGYIYVDAYGRILYRQHENNVVGLKTGTKAKIRRAKDYIYKSNASIYSKELLQGYKDVMAPEWVRFHTDVVKANSSFRSRLSLLKSKKIDFNSKTLRILFIIKVLLKKL